MCRLRHRLFVHHVRRLCHVGIICSAVSRRGAAQIMLRSQIATFVTELYTTKMLPCPFCFWIVIKLILGEHGAIDCITKSYETVGVYHSGP